MSLTEIIVLLDRSGSMTTCADDHRGGLKQFVEDQKKLDGSVNFTLALFDDTNPFELVYDRVDIQKVEDIPLNPRGLTPLLDSLGKAIGHISDAINKDQEKPNQVVFMCVTDGAENSSKEFTIDSIKNLIKEKEDEKQTNPPWNFLYLGANIDSFGVASSIGMSNLRNVANFSNNSVGTHAAYSGTSCAVSRGREMLFEMGPLEIYEGDKNEYYETINSVMAYTKEEKTSFTSDN